MHDAVGPLQAHCIMQLLMHPGQWAYAQSCLGHDQQAALLVCYGRSDMNVETSAELAKRQCMTCHAQNGSSKLQGPSASLQGYAWTGPSDAITPWTDT